ncbi:MAG: TonB-dependent receptor [Candidatus Aminicenantes bacterium]|nr:MAG: TonB-dependent receptor [Candidatus Aminicenantes bacterium]
MILVGLVLISGFLAAQVPTGGRIIGTITDEEGQPLPGVTVETSSPKLVGKVTTISDMNGSYRLLALPSGAYEITFSLEGFNTVVRKGVILEVEQTLKLDITMPLGTLAEEITVIGESPLVDVRSTVKGMVLTKQMFQILPRGRDFSTLVATIPGVQNEPGLGGISVDGASGAENMFYIDGMDTTHVSGGEQAQDANFDFVEEVQIKASGYQAEYGGSLGGVINVITRSGGNTFHGGVNFYYSGSALNGKERDSLRLNPVSRAVEYVNYQDMYGKDKITRYEPGVELGGYVIKDRLWFYANFMPIFRKTTRSTEFLSGETGDYENTRKWMNASAKITAQPLKNLRMSLGFLNNWYQSLGTLPPRDGTGNYAYDWAAPGTDYPNKTFTGSADLTVGNNFLVSARGGWFKTDLTNQRVIPTERQLRFYYRAGYLDLYNWPEALRKPYGWRNTSDLYATTKRTYERKAIYTDANYFLSLGGEHSIKFGASFVRVANDLAEGSLFPLIMLRIGYPYETYTGEEYMGTYGHYRSYWPLGFPAFENNHSDRFALYLQDSWTIADKLTLNVGVRAETEFIPTFSDDPKFSDVHPIDFKFGDKLAPRLGFIYDVFGDSTLKVFGSFGLFYDVMKMSLAEGLYGGDKYVVTYYTLDTMEWEKIGTPEGDGFYLPGTQVDRLDWRIPAIESTDPELKPMTQSETSFGLEKQLSENVSFSARFVYKHLIKGIEDIGQMTAEGEVYIIGNPGFGTSSVIDPTYPPTPKAQRNYHALNISVDKRFSNNWFGGIAYTWSRLWGNYCGLNSADEWGRNDPNTNRYWDYWFLMRDQNLEDSVGLLPTDRTHFLKVYGSYVFPFGLTVGTVINAYSGIPFTTEITLNNQQGYYPNGRMDTGERTPFMFYSNLYAEYNLRIADTYKIQFNINIDNVWNADTARRMYPNYNLDSPYLTDAQILAKSDYHDYVLELDPRYAKDYDFLPSISVRLGLRFQF